MKFAVEVFTAQSALEAKDAVLAIWKAVYSLPPDNESEEDIESWLDQWANIVAKPEFSFVGIRDNEEVLCGIAHGWRISKDEKLGQRLLESLEDRGVEWLADCFFLADLVVIPSQQGKGLGSDLMDSLAATVKNKTLLLITHQRSTVATEMYLRRGWIELKANFVAANGKTYRVFGKKNSL